MENDQTEPFISAITTKWRETSRAGMNFAEGQNHFRNKKKRTSGKIVWPSKASDEIQYSLTLQLGSDRSPLRYASLRLVVCAKVRDERLEVAKTSERKKQRAEEYLRNAHGN